MDPRRFDDFARSLATTSRRSVLRFIAAGALAGARVAIGPEPAGAACRGLGQECGRNGQCCSGARCRDGRCACRRGFEKIAGRCAPKCGDPCVATCNSCAGTYDLKGSFCSANQVGCAGLTESCRSHADCGPTELCSFTTCDEINGTTNRCQPFCGA